MNERIRDLYEQAYKQSRPSPGLFEQIFAELIVRECADLVQDDDNAFDILKHFGVEQ